MPTFATKTDNIYTKYSFMIYPNNSMNRSIANVQK